jgi:hypothetical protein
VATQVPLAAKAPSPAVAAGTGEGVSEPGSLRKCQSRPPSRVASTGKTPFTLSLKAMPLSASQNAKQS